MNTADGRAPGLDLLRALGVGAVLFAHGGWYLFAAWPAYDAYALAGWLGTEMFFALSGFLVTRQLLELPRQSPRTNARYLGWRLWRIVPLYWVFLALNLVLAMQDGRGVPEQGWRYALLIQNAASPHPAFFGEAWNLPLLVAFTLVAPGLVLAASAASRPRKVLAVLLGVLLLLGIALRAAWVVEQDPAWDAGVRKLALARVDACLYGALAALLPPGSMRVRFGAGVSGIVALGVAALAFLWLGREASDAVRIASFVVSGFGCAALCVATLGSKPWRGDIVTAWIAHIAWPLYLVNLPVLYVLAMLGVGQSGTAAAGVLRSSLWIALSVAAAMLVRWAMEGPWLALRARLFGAVHALPASRR